MSSSFPLFRLPLVALADVINALGLEDLIILTCSSRKSRRIAKMLYKQNKKVKIRANFIQSLMIHQKNGVEFSLYLCRIPKKSNYETIRIGDEMVQMKKKPDQKGMINGWIIYYNDFDHGVKMIFDWLTEFFDRSTIPEISVFAESYNEKARSTIDWMLSKFPKIGYCYIQFKEVSDNEYQKVLEVCSFMDDFSMMAEPSVRFPRQQFSFAGSYFLIEGAFWFSFDNLMSVHASTCIIVDTRLTSLELNQFVRRWMDGEFSYLAHICVGVEVIELGVLLADLNAVDFPENTKRTYMYLEKHTRVVEYGYDIRRNDGTLATIVHDGSHDQNYLRMLVWSGL